FTPRREGRRGRPGGARSGGEERDAVPPAPRARGHRQQAHSRAARAGALRARAGSGESPARAREERTVREGKRSSSQGEGGKPGTTCCTSRAREPARVLLGRGKRSGRAAP